MKNTVIFLLLVILGVGICFAQSSSLILNFVSWGVYSGPTYITVRDEHMYVSSNAFVVLDISDRYSF